MKKRIKKPYTMTLNSEDTAYVKRALAKTDMTLSGFVRAAIREFRETLEKGEEKNKFADMSAAEFLEAVEIMREKIVKND